MCMYNYVVYACIVCTCVCCVYNITRFGLLLVVIALCYQYYRLKSMHDVCLFLRTLVNGNLIYKRELPPPLFLHHLFLLLPLLLLIPSPLPTSSPPSPPPHPLPSSYITSSFSPSSSSPSSSSSSSSSSPRLLPFSPPSRRVSQS